MNVLVLGERGSGKTSFVYRLRSQLEGDGAAVAFVSGRLADSAADLLALLRDAFDAWPRHHITDVGRSVRAAASAVSEGFVIRPPAGETQTLLSGLEGLRRGLPEEHAYVLVDELSSVAVARTLFGRLRDELWELPLTWLVAATKRDRLAYTEPPADAFFGRILELGPLDEEACRTLLRRRLEDTKMPESTIGQLVAEAKGHPRRLLSLASSVVTGETGTSQLRKRSAELAARLAELSEPAQRLVEELEAGGPASPSDDALLQRLGWKRSRASQVFAELERNGLVRAASRAGAGTRPRKVYELTG